MERSFAVKTVWDPTSWTSTFLNTLAIEERLTYLESLGIRGLPFENREPLEIPDYVVGAFDLRCVNNHPVCGNKDAVFF